MLQVGARVRHETLMRMLARYRAVMESDAALPARGAPADLFALSCRLHSGHRRGDAGPVEEHDAARGTIRPGAILASGERYETPVTGGHARLQWEARLEAMRWVARAPPSGVD